jgi:MFS family permease
MTTAAESDSELPAYATPPRPKRVKRIRLALLVSSLAACLSVTLIGQVLSGMAQMVSGISGLSFMDGEYGFLNGMMMALMMAGWNFILFFITVPACALALGLSVGRFPQRGIVARKPYLRWGAIWGAILVGGTTFLFGWVGGWATAAGALFAGSLVGAMAGIFCGYLMHKIINPAKQLSDVDINVF